MTFKHLTVAALAAMLAAPVALAEPTPGDPPRRQRPDNKRQDGQQQGNPRKQLQRFVEAVNGLKLDADRRATVDAAMDEMRQTLRSLDRSDRAAFRDKAREATQRAREAVTAVLSDDEKRQLREAMQQDRPDRDRRGRRNQAGRDGKLRLDGGDLPASGDTLAPDGRPSLFAPAPEPRPAGDVVVHTLSGRETTLAELRKDVRVPTVVVACNLSSPHFRDKAAGLESLRRELGRDVNWVWLYASESHPTGGGEVTRNADAGLSVDAPATLEARADLARRTQRDGGLGGEIVIDGLNEATLGALGIESVGAAVLNADLQVTARDDWADPTAIRRALRSLDAAE